MKITILDGSHDGAGTSQTVTDADDVTIEKPLPAGTDIRIEQVTGKARIDSISVAEK